MLLVYLSKKYFLCTPLNNGLFIDNQEKKFIRKCHEFVK